MFATRKVTSSPLLISKPKGVVHDTKSVLMTLLTAIRFNQLGLSADNKRVERWEVLKATIPPMLPNMDEHAFRITMSILTGCGKQIKVRKFWVDRGEFEFDSWVAAHDLREYNLRESPAISNEWIHEFMNKDKPINVLMPT